MRVRAKFKLDAIERTSSQVVKRNDDGTPVTDARGYHVYEQGEVNTVKFSPVYANGDPNHENSKFWAASPSGSLLLGTVNADAAASFKLGKEYYIDFTDADPETPASA